MADQPRSLPEQPSLRYLKVEAKRRLAAGEFGNLHDAQLAIAREHGQSSWAVLRQQIELQVARTRSEPGGYALARLRWLIARFAAADDPGWAAPSESELLEHVDGRFLSSVSRERLVRVLVSHSGQLREELVVRASDPLHVRAQAGGMQFEAAAMAEPPHRLTGLLVYPVGAPVTDTRAAAPSTSSSAGAPAAAVAVADTAFAELGLVALELAGAEAAETPWVIARGWADLESGELLTADHRFPAYSITKLITATAALRLAADGVIGLDDPANEYLNAVRLADGTVTIRELLSHTGGVDSPDRMFADTVPDMAALTGSVLGCGGPRGEFSYSNGGYGALGQLIADVTGQGYAEAATRLVLQPLGMTNSWFPALPPVLSQSAVTCYDLQADGSFRPAPARVCTIPAAGGLWATAADLARFGTSWSSLLPESLASEALRPHAVRNPAVHFGLGWVVNEVNGAAGHPGGGVGGASSLVVRRGANQVLVALTNRRVPIEPVNGRVIRATA